MLIGHIQLDVQAMKAVVGVAALSKMYLNPLSYANHVFFLLHC